LRPHDSPQFFGLNVRIYSNRSVCWADTDKRTTRGTKCISYGLLVPGVAGPER
jgi:hypothetical protein